MQHETPLAFLFPGQGAQFVGMGEDLYRNSFAAHRIFDTASEVLSFDVSEACFQDPDDVINITEYTQPLLLTTTMATYAAFRELCPDVKPTYLSGLSLGEYSALISAGSLEFAQAVGLVRQRGKFMQEAVPRGVGGMAAVLGLPADVVRQLCTESSTEGSWVEPANYNCPGQIAVSGHLAAVKLLCQKAKAVGATRAVQLPVSAPFHNRLLKPAGDQLAVALEGVSVKDAEVPVVVNVSAEPLTRAQEIRAALITQVYSPVLMEQSLKAILSAGVRTLIEFGPGDSLAKFVKRIDETATVYSVGDMGTLETCVREIF